MRRIIRGSEGDSDDSEAYCVRSFSASRSPTCPGKRAVNGRFVILCFRDLFHRTKIKQKLQTQPRTIVQ